MDDNQRQVLVAILGLLGVLGGIWLGWLLQVGRRRHDEAKRTALANYIGVIRELLGEAQDGRRTGSTLDQPRARALGREIWQTFGLIQILCEDRTVTAAEAVHSSVLLLLTNALGDVRPRDAAADERWERDREIVDERLVSFMLAARHELGSKPCLEAAHSTRLNPVHLWTANPPEIAAGRAALAAGVSPPEVGVWVPQPVDRGRLALTDGRPPT